MLNCKESIKNWLETTNIKSYLINSDLSVEVYGGVYLGHKDLESIPVQFGIVKGNFSCVNNKLKSLKGCPHIVEEEFSCNNNELISLEYSPINFGK